MDSQKVVFLMKKLLQKKYLIFIIPAILLLILLIAAAPGAIYREHHYRSAMNALHEGDLTAAQDLLADIPMYRDSETILNSEIPYIKADGLMAAAESGDSSMLETAGYSAADLKEDTTVSMLLYRSAGEAFEALGDYKDSASRSEECRAGVEREARMLREQAEEELRRQHQETYDHAVSLLDSGAYSEALSVFESLGDFSDSQKMASECLYRKAVALYQFLTHYDVSRIYAGISTDPDGTSIFSLSTAEALRLGSSFVDELRDACGKDKYDIRLEDTPGTNLMLLKDALSEMFLSLGDYADSASYPQQIAEVTDYTRDFFMLCSTGDLDGAQSWLYSFDGEFSDRDRWQGLLNLYLPYCGYWELYSGSPDLLPYTIDQSFQALSMSSRVILTRDSALLRLSFGPDQEYNIDLPCELGDTSFVADLDTGFYMAALNNGHFVYHRYDSDWNPLSSCDFIPG